MIMLEWRRCGVAGDRDKTGRAVGDGVYRSRGPVRRA